MRSLLSALGAINFTKKKEKITVPQTLVKNGNSQRHVPSHADETKYWDEQTRLARCFGSVSVAALWYNSSLASLCIYYGAREHLDKAHD